MDRYDPRDVGDRADSWDRNFGSRGGTSERDRDNEGDPRDVFTKDLDLPRGRERRPVRDRDRVYEINGAESRMLATVGAFRVVAESDLHDGRDDTRETHKGLRHLEREGLIRTSPLSSDERVVVLTGRGRDLLEANRYERHDRAHEPRQTFWAGLRKPRELTHDTKVYRAYQRAEERLREQGGSVRRVVLDYGLKRDYQRFLQERNRGKNDCDGRPDREPQEIAHWAREHDLPYDDGHVHFPDARIEYDETMLSASEMAAQIGPELRKKITTGERTQWYFTCSLWLPEVKHKVRVVILWDRWNSKEPAKILVTNQTHWEVTRVLRGYRGRWTGTETLHRDGKQHLGMGDCQLRNGEGQTRHLYLVLLVHSLLVAQLRQGRVSAWACETLTTIGEACRAVLRETLGKTISWAIERATLDGWKKERIKAHLALV